MKQQVAAAKEGNVQQAVGVDITLRGDGTVAKGANAVAAGAADAAVAMPARCADTARRAPTTRFGKDSVDSGTMLEPPGLDESACLASWPLRVSSTSALAQQLL